VRVEDSAPFMAAKQNAPRLNLSPGTYVDQPSPKCCSRTRLRLFGKLENGPFVPCLGGKGWHDGYVSVCHAGSSVPPAAPLRDSGRGVFFSVELDSQSGSVNAPSS
jgi:hypothetical protein